MNTRPVQLRNVDPNPHLSPAAYLAFIILHSPLDMLSFYRYPCALASRPRFTYPAINWRPFRLESICHRTTGLCCLSSRVMLRPLYQPTFFAVSTSDERALLVRRHATHVARAPRAILRVGPTVVTLMETPDNVFLVAEETNGDDNSKSLVGCVHVCWSGVTDSGDEDVDAHFGMLSVPKECSGRGIGRLLVSAAGALRAQQTAGCMHAFFFCPGQVCENSQTM